MSNNRYHIHVVCVANDTLLQVAQDDVAMFFEQRAFLTRDLLVMRPESAGYSWRCINACDAVIVLIGQEYGQANATGVSQLHISYANARTRHKPVLVLIHTDALQLSETTKDSDRRLADFVQSVEGQMNDNVWHFNDSTNLTMLFNDSFDRLVSAIEEQRILGHGNHHEVAENPLDKIVKANKYDIEDVHTALKPALVLDSECLVNCTAHAFQGGTLIDASFVMPFIWRDIVVALTDLEIVFSQQGLARCLNELIDKDAAIKIISRQYPSIHAVSRCQVSKEDVAWIQDKLRLTNWIEPAMSTGVNQGNLWRVTDSAKSAVDLVFLQGKVMTADNFQDTIQAFDSLSDTMHKAEKKRTLEEQVAYLKSQGIDPAKSYADWDDDKDDWGK